MDRARFRVGFRMVFLGLLGLPLLAGCQGALFTAMYLIKGNDVEPEYTGLKNKHVAVVCRAQPGLAWAHPNLSKEVSRAVSKILATKGNKIKVVDQRKIEKRLDEAWDEFVEVGKAVDADMVVGIDLERLQLHEGQTLLRGRADVSIKVCDCKSGDVVYEKSPPQVVYPPNICIHTSEKSTTQFEREFVLVLADRISRSFCPYDPHADFGQDAQAAK